MHHPRPPPGPADPDQGDSRWVLAAALVTVLGILARFIHLDADPQFSLWMGYVTDEGRWNETARNLALFGRAELYGLSTIHLVLSPAFQAVNFLVFEVAGVSLWTARLLSALAGSLLVVLSVLVLHRRTDPLALVVGASFLSFGALGVNLSRMAVPEMPALLLCGIAFFTLVLGGERRVAGLLAGVALAGAVSMKGTTVLMAPAYVLALVALGRGNATRGPMSRVAWFVSGLVLPALAGLGVAALIGVLPSLSLRHVAQQFAQFLDVGSAYTIASRLLDTVDWVPTNCLLLSFWFGSWISLVPGAARDHSVRALWIGSGVWGAWALLIWGVQAYSPGRYLEHVVYPLTLHAIIVASLWRREGLGPELTDRLATSRGASGLGRAIWLAVPTAILLAPALARCASTLGLDAARLSHRIGSILFMVVPIALVANRLSARRGAVRFLLAFPAVLTGFWLVNSQFQEPLGFWTGGTMREQYLFWSALVVAIGAALAVSDGNRAGQRLIPVMAIAICLLMMATAIHETRALYSPTYTIRDASRDLGRRFSTEDLLWSVQASSLFLENRLHYRDEVRLDQAVDAVVVLSGIL